MSRVAHQAGAYPGFRGMKRLGIFQYSPLDGMLVHHRVTPSIKFVDTHLYTRVERRTVRVKCLAHEQNTMFPASSRTRTARSVVERTNHEATAPPTIQNTPDKFEFEKNLGKGNYVMQTESPFSKSSLFKMFSVRPKTKSWPFQNPPVCRAFSKSD